MKVETAIKNKQYHNFDIEIYPDCELYHDANGINCSAYEVLLYLIQDVNVNEYAFIMHDKDIDDNGEHKKNHYHLYVRYHCYYRIQALSNRYGIPTTNFGLFPKKDKHGNVVKAEDGTPIGYEEPNRKLRLRYLTHADSKDQDKVQYNIADINTNIVGFNWRDDVDKYTEEDALIEYAVNHSERETWEYVKIKDLRAEYKKNSWIVDRLRKESNAINSYQKHAIDTAYINAKADADEIMKKRIDKAIVNAINDYREKIGKDTFIYDMEGNVIGAC